MSGEELGSEFNRHKEHQLIECLKLVQHLHSLLRHDVSRSFTLMAFLVPLRSFVNIINATVAVASALPSLIGESLPCRLSIAIRA